LSRGANAAQRIWFRIARKIMTEPRLR